MTQPVVTPWPMEPGLLSEGPRWHEERQELLWVDVLGKRFHRARVGADGLPGDVRTVAVDRHVGAVAPVAGGGYVLAAGQGFLRVSEDGEVRELVEVPDADPAFRMNDAACDPQGRFWARTMAYNKAPGAGALYRLERDGTCTKVLSDLTISNGLGWSPDGATMYLNDSGAGTVSAFAFDAATGALSDRRTVARIDAPGTGPDGLTVGEDGDLWVGVYNGWAVRRYGPDGTPRDPVRLPVAQATSCAFGGPDRRTLFVTTGRENLDAAALERQPDAGRIFAVTGLDGARGPACSPYRGRVS